MHPGVPLQDNASGFELEAPGTAIVEHTHSVAGDTGGLRVECASRLTCSFIESLCAPASIIDTPALGYGPPRSLQRETSGGLYQFGQAISPTLRVPLGKKSRVNRPCQRHGLLIVKTKRRDAQSNAKGRGPCSVG